MKLALMIKLNHVNKIGYDSSSYKNQNFVIGIYPLLPDSNCWFLAADFDKKTWQTDASFFLKTCKKFDIPAHLERSRSGNGGHVWFFFCEPIPADIARRMGSYILTETMEEYPEIGFDSYDRFFPNQDLVPKDGAGFGNLIALPFQGKAIKNGNTLFINENFEPWNDQWQYLSDIKRMSYSEVKSIADEASRKGRILGVRIAVTEEDDEPWKAKPSRKAKELPLSCKLPKKIEIIYGDQLYISKENLPSPLYNRLIRTAAFQNPEFYKAQAMRLSTYGKPRIISCCEDHSNHIGLPRGCLDEVISLLQSIQVNYNITEKRFSGNPIDVNFSGNLLPDQESAVKALIPYENGVLSASTAFGKTVIGAYMLAQRKVNTIILVHRKQLMEQWKERLQMFLDLPKNAIGQIGGGKRKPTGIIDIAVMQSLYRKNTVDDIVGDHGLMIVDECHHIAAVSFEMIAKRCKAKYFLGLSATVTRKDGQHPIIFMQLGPLRYKVSDKEQAEKRPFNHEVYTRKTNFSLNDSNVEELQIQQIYASLCTDSHRNKVIVEDILQAIKQKRSPIVLTERKEHVELISSLLSVHSKKVLVLKGGLGKKKVTSIINELSQRKTGDGTVLVATGRYIGEGFDDERLDTLFLAHPVSWKGTLSQYAGRLHRLHHAKKKVVVYDYADLKVPVLARMYERRVHGYKAIGYSICEEQMDLISTNDT